MDLPKHEPMTFHKGLVTNGTGEPSQTEAYVTYGSAHGENPDDAEIVISGGGAAKAATTIEAIPALIDALKSLMVAYGAADGRNGNSGECWDKARSALGALGIWNQTRGICG